MSVLRKRVLILNKDWMAIGTCTVRRAITLISNNDENIAKAKIVDEDWNIYEWSDWLNLDPRDSFIRSVSRKIKIPSVIICRTKTLPRLHPSFTRTAVFLRDNYTCLYCDKKISKNNITMDHVLPRCRGGKNNWFNCVSCCVSCNNYKGDRTPEEARMELSKEPSRPPLILCEEPIPDFWKNFI